MTRGIARKFCLASTMIMALAVFGCSSVPSIRTSIKPSESKRQYLNLKKVAILPLENVAGEKGAENQVVDLLLTELNISNAFEEVEEPRYVASVLKALKIRKIDALDAETVSKLGSEMKAQAILFGDINAWGLGEGSEAAMHVSMTLTLLDTTTGKPIWVGSGSHRGSFSWGRVFGLNEGPTDLDIGREVVHSLVKAMTKEIEGKRKAELVRIKADESAKLKAAAEAEKRRLEEQMKTKEPGK
ncbi:MAG TPA: hypothetical protein ENH32_04410 [Proteobacteria bacterium]|nr:hypothetical protein BMS3Abin14_01411 [bacterium BMS3Abin14]HDL53195.1 hypothetical protein [Pseudomonadota bacterium]